MGGLPSYSSQWRGCYEGICCPIVVRAPYCCWLPGTGMSAEVWEEPERHLKTPCLSPRAVCLPRVSARNPERCKSSRRACCLLDRQLTEVETTSMSKMRPRFWWPLTAKICLLVQLAVLASTLGDGNICAVSGLFPGVLVENSVEHFCKGSDFLPTTRCPVSSRHSRKSKLFVFVRLAFPPLEPSLENPLPSTSPERVLDTTGGCAFTPASGLLPC